MEIAEAEMAVEVRSRGGEGVNDDGAGAEFVAAPDAARERIYEQVPAQGLSLLGTVEREAGKQHDWNRIWHSAA